MPHAIHEMRSHLIFDDLGGQSSHRGAGTRKEVHDLFAWGLSLRSALDCLDLPTDTSDAGEPFLLVTDRMDHGPL